jgi:trimethylamine:corrinoid methyltransferase-like protein
MDKRHTLRHVRDDWVPTLMDRYNDQRWAARRTTTLQERANKKVCTLLENQRAERLPDDVVAAVDAVVTG